MQIFGFLGLFIMGFAYHAVPRFAGVTFRWRGWALASLGLQLGGVLAIVAGFLFAPAWAGVLWPAGAGAILVAADVRGRAGHHAALAPDAARAVRALGPRGPCLVRVGAAAGLAAALGFATQMLIGVGCRFEPVFSGRRLWSPRAHSACFWLLNGAVLLRCLEGAIAAGYWAGAWPLVALAGPPAVAAVALFALNIAMALFARAASSWR